LPAKAHDLERLQEEVSLDEHPAVYLKAAMDDCRRRLALRKHYVSEKR
jgi:IS5 family transposase